MRRVENLIENKGLINTFKKLKTKNHLNKSFLKKRDFFFLKLKQFRFNFFIKNFSKKKFFIKNFSKKLKINNTFIFSHKNEKNFSFFKLVLMFVKLYF